MLKKALVVAGAMIAATVSVQADAQALGGIRILNISGITESSLNATNMTTARSVLTGAGATVTDVAVGSFSAASLTGINVVYAGLTNGSFTASQIAAIDGFVNAGGGLVAVGTERGSFSTSAYEQLANSFGLYGIGGDHSVAATATAPASPVVTGPFGVAASYQPAATGAFDASRLPTGSTMVWKATDNTPVIATLNAGGNAVFFADTNFMENSFITSGGNRAIWGNAFAYAAAVPEPASWAMMIVGIGAVGFSLRSAKRRSDAKFDERIKRIAAGLA